jgi:hypothetical protein
MEYRTRGRGNPLKPEEHERIKELFMKLGNKAAVARAVNRTSFSVATVLGTNSKQNAAKRKSGEFFDWKDYNNSII